MERFATGIAQQVRQDAVDQRFETGETSTDDGNVDFHGGPGSRAHGRPGQVPGFESRVEGWKAENREDAYAIM